MSNRKGGIGAFSRAWRTPNPGAHRKFIPVCRVRGGHVAGKGTKKDVASYESAYLAKGSYCANWNCKIANWTCSRTRPSPASRPHAHPLPSFAGDGFRGKVFPGKLFVTLAFPRRILDFRLAVSRDFNTCNYATRGLFDRV